MCFIRPPFEGSDEYTKKRNDLVKLGMDLIQTEQHEGSNNEHRDNILHLVSAWFLNVECVAIAWNISKFVTNIKVYGAHFLEHLIKKWHSVNFNQCFQASRELGSCNCQILNHDGVNEPIHEIIYHSNSWVAWLWLEMPRKC